MKLISASILIATVVTTGCASTGHVSSGEHFAMYGTPEGIRAYGDYMIGSLKTGKEKPKARNQYLAMRLTNEAQYTARELHKPKSFLTKLFEQDESRDETGNAATEKETN